jgi:hypothetical protein
MTIRRLNLGCGPVAPPDWTNSDRESWPGADFVRVRRVAFGRTGSPFAEIVALDNRQRETLFVEAVR